MWGQRFYGVLHLSVTVLFSTFRPRPRALIHLLKHIVWNSQMILPNTWLRMENRDRHCESSGWSKGLTQLTSNTSVAVAEEFVEVDDCSFRHC